MYTFIKNFFNTNIEENKTQKIKQTRKQSKKKKTSKTIKKEIVKNTRTKLKLHNKNKNTSKTIKKTRTTQTKYELQNKNKKKFDGGLNQFELNQKEIELDKQKESGRISKENVRKLLYDIDEYRVTPLANQLYDEKVMIEDEKNNNKLFLENKLQDYKNLLDLVWEFNTQVDDQLDDYVQQINNRGRIYKYFNDLEIRDINLIQAHKESYDILERVYKNVEEENKVLQKIVKVYKEVIKDDKKINEIVNYLGRIKNQNQKFSSKCSNNDNLCKIVKCDEEKVNWIMKCKIHKYVVTNYAKQRENEYNDIMFTDLKNNGRRREAILEKTVGKKSKVHKLMFDESL